MAVLESVSVTLDIYRRALSRGAALAARNVPVLLSVFAYAGILFLGGYLAVFLGIIGGFLMSLLFAACASSFLYLVEMIVRTNKVTWEDFTRSFGVYLWDVVGVSFALWLFWFVATPFLHQLPQGHVAVVAIQLVLVVLFNAVPELIYLGHSGVLDLLSRSYQFIAANWVEWFPPNLLFIAGIELLWWLPLGPGMVSLIARVALLSLFVYFAMVVRGFLFIELDGSSRRSRLFRHKMGR
jgi:hypothetical protein